MAISEPERLGMLAALVGADGDTGGATTAELDLADAIRGTSMASSSAAAVAGLLRLADGSPLTGALRIVLREKFLDGQPADHGAEFADIYERLALPGLTGEARDQAPALLAALTG